MSVDKNMEGAESSILLVGMSNGTATLGNSMIVPQNIKTRIPM